MKKASEIYYWGFALSSAGVLLHWLVINWPLP